MIRYARNTFVGLLAFVLGVTVTGDSVSKTTIEQITKDVASYDGRVVTIESFLRCDELDGELACQVGEPFEKAEAMVFLRFDHVSDSLSTLRSKLSHGATRSGHNRSKVRVTGRVTDNCNSGITCCFGQTMTIDVSSITQLGPVESYILPR